MHDVESEITVPVAPERALSAFLDPRDLAAWWGVHRALVDPHPGGTWALAWGDDEELEYVATGIIASYEPAASLRIEQFLYFNPERQILGPMSLTVEARPASSNGSHLRVIQAGYRDGADWAWYHAAVTKAWPVALEGLRVHLAATGSGHGR